MQLQTWSQSLARMLCSLAVGELGARGAADDRGVTDDDIALAV
jgi:hypothetical protein